MNSIKHKPRAAKRTVKQINRAKIDLANAVLTILSGTPEWDANTTDEIFQAGRNLRLLDANGPDGACQTIV